MREATHIWEEHSIKKRHNKEKKLKKKFKKRKGTEREKKKQGLESPRINWLLCYIPPPTFFRPNIIPKGVNSI